MFVVLALVLGAGAGADAQDVESDGEEEASCAEPDGAQVPVEVEYCVHNLAHRLPGLRGWRSMEKNQSYHLKCMCGF